MKSTILALSLFLIATPALAACTQPIPPADCFGYKAYTSSCKNLIRTYEADSESYKICTADEAIKNEEQNQIRACEDSTPENGNASMAGSRCKITCDEGFYLTVSGACKIQTTRTTDSLPISKPVSAPVVQVVPATTVPTTDTSAVRPSITKPVQNTQLGSPRTETVTETPEEPAVPQAKSHWFSRFLNSINPLRWFGF